MASRLAPGLLDLVGDTPLVELTRLAPKSGVQIYAKLEGRTRPARSRTASRWR
jgi:cysteine synthase